MRFDQVIIAAVVGLALVIGILSVASARFGPAVDGMTTAQTLDGTSINTQIGLTFTDRMNVRSVERSFSIEPRVPGDFNWSGNTLIYSPRHSLTYGRSYTVTVKKSATDTTGRHLFHAFRSTFSTQVQHLLYLGTSGSERGRLVLISVSGKRRTVGPDDGSVTDFSVSFDRSLAVYVRRGGSGERADEIWLLSLADGSSQRLFRRPDWSLSQPHMSPDGRSIVFLATNVMVCPKYYGCSRSTATPIIYLLDPRSGKAAPFHSAGDTPITDFIDFSPAGQLAYTDLGSALTLADPSGKHILHVPNRGNSLEFVGFDAAGDKAAFVGQTPDSTGGDVLIYESSGGKYIDISRHVYDSSTPAIATSGKQVAYAAYRGELGIEPIYGINVYTFAGGRTQPLTGEKRWSDWAPQWSTDDRYIAFVRSRPQEAMYLGSGEVWVMRDDGREARPLGGVGKQIQWVS